jgi:hypothetical protein
MGAALVPIDIDQGEDWTTSIVYTDSNDEPYEVIHPCRMDIKNNTGATQLSLMSPATPPTDGSIPDIMLSSEQGIIQIHIEDTVTKSLLPGTYKYDLFVTVTDNGAYAGTQIQRLIYGSVTVHQRVTQL